MNLTSLPLKTMNATRNLSLALAFTASLTAQIDRESNAPVDYQHLRHASLTDIQSWSAQGYRMSNFEISNPGLMELNVSMVRNTGVYAAGWYFYFDKTVAELQSICTNNNRRIVDLERYEIGGVEKFAALLFTNSGQQQKTWHWFTGIPMGSVNTTVGGIGDRVIDLEPYLENGNTFFHAITIANTGADQKAWWVYTNTTVSGVQGYMAQHNARLYDFEMWSIIPYACACVLVQDDITSLTLWGEYYGSGFNEDDERGGRVVVQANQSITGHVITLLDNESPFYTWGVGCPGTNGVSSHTASGNAMTGTQITYRTNNLWPWTIAVLCYGDSLVNGPLAAIGAPGCTAYTLPFATTTHFANGSGVATGTLNVPQNPSLQGASLKTQFAAFDPPLNDLGMQFSNALVTSIRHW